MSTGQRNYFRLHHTQSRDHRDHYFHFRVSTHPQSPLTRIYTYLGTAQPQNTKATLLDQIPRMIETKKNADKSTFFLSIICKKQDIFVCLATKKIPYLLIFSYIFFDVLLISSSPNYNDLK